MKYFITGASGYLGWETCKMLLAQGHQVNALCRHNGEMPAIDGLTWKYGSLENYESIYLAMQGCQRVIHAAALARMWHNDPSVFYSVNVGGTENVLKAALELQIEKLAFTSTAGVMGSDNTNPMCETDPPPDRFETDYESSKHQAELKVLDYVKRGHWATILRPTRIYGSGKLSGSTPLNKLLSDYLKRPFYFIPGDGSVIGNYVHVRDVAKGHLLAMEHGRSGEKYMIGGENISYTEIFHLFEKLTSLRRYRIKITPKTFFLIAYMTEGFARISGKPATLKRGIVRRLFENRIISIEKAKSELGYQPIQMETGLQETLAAWGLRGSH